MPKLDVTRPGDGGGVGGGGLRSGASVRRAESLRAAGGAGGAASGPSSLTVGGGGGGGADASRLKRNPSFTTRKRTSSLRKVGAGNKLLEANPAGLPPVETAGFLERKHEQQSGGKRAAIRSWKTYYTGASSPPLRTPLARGASLVSQAIAIPHSSKQIRMPNLT